VDPVQSDGTFDVANPLSANAQPVDSGSAANIVAVIVLVLLVGSLIERATSAVRPAKRLEARLLRLTHQRVRWLVLGLAVIGVGLAISLVAGAFDNVAVLILAIGVVIAFGTVLFAAASPSPQKRLTDWSVGLMIVAGFAVAAYLAYVESTLSDAVCGLLGNCNIVQQSEYARLLGVPIGIIGAVGYIAIGLTWWLARRQPSATSGRLLFGMTIFGVAFSTYLTFLEPFVIKASCAWCLTSSIIMLVLMWLVYESRLPNEKPSRPRKYAHQH
jgi:uncharacterized membrane protein